MAYPTKPTGNDILPLDVVFADNNDLKTAMTTNEILDGYNNDGETETQLTSRPDANRFNMFWYQVHNTIKWIISYIEELYTAKLEKSGGTMTGLLNMGSNKITSTYTPQSDSDLTNKKYVDNAINSSMWLGEVKMLSYPTLPSLPAGVEVVPCDGRAVSRTTYAKYFSMVGTALEQEMVALHLMFRTIEVYSFVVGMAIVVEIEIEFMALFKILVLLILPQKLNLLKNGKHTVYILIVVHYI